MSERDGIAVVDKPAGCTSHDLSLIHIYAADE